MGKRNKRNAANTEMVDDSIVPSQILVSQKLLDGWNADPNPFFCLLCAQANTVQICDYGSEEERKYHFKKIDEIATTGRVPRVFDDDILQALVWGLSCSGQDERNFCHFLLFLNSFKTEKYLDDAHLLPLLESIFQVECDAQKWLSAGLGFLAACAKAFVYCPHSTKEDVHNPIALFSLFLMQVTNDPFDPRLKALAVQVEMAEEAVFQDLSHFSDQQHGQWFIRLFVVEDEQTRWYQLADSVLTKARTINPENQSIAWIHLLVQG